MNRPRSTRLVPTTRLLTLALPLLLTACGTGRSGTAPASRPLSADSARILQQAVARAKPAYATQEQALRAGIYQRGPLLAATPPREAPAEPVRAPAAPPVRTPPAAAPRPEAAAPAVEVRRTVPVELLGEETGGGSPGTSARPSAPAAAPVPEPRADAPPAAREDHAAAAVERGGEDAPSMQGRFVVQIAAYRDRASAERVRSEAERSLTPIRTAVEEEAGVYRVVVGGWGDEAAARARLAAIQEHFPTAWVRLRSLP